MKLCVFDFDSTLMDGETIDEIAAACGKKEEVSRITRQAMAGELDFYESLTRRVALLKGLYYPDVLDICQQLPLMNGAKETIAELKKHGYKVIIFSGGFHEATYYFKDQLGYDAEFANNLHHKGQVLSGCVGGEMMFNDSKGVMLKRMQGLLQVSEADTLVVGDGANDLSMFAHAGTRVAFCAKPVLQKAANVIVSEKDLRLLLDQIELS